MSAIIMKSRRSRSLAFFSALAVTISLVVPLLAADTASANHPGGATLEVSNETAELSPGTTHTLTARLFDDVTETPRNASVGEPVQIHFEVEGGPGGTVITDDQTRGATPRSYSSDVSRTAPDMACTIAAGQSTCFVEFTSNLGGTNLVRAWINHSQTISTFDGDGTEGRFSGGPTVPGKAYVTDCRSAITPGTQDATCSPNGATAGEVIEPDITDVVAVTWIAPSPARCIDAEPETDTNRQGTNHVIEAQVTNQDAGFVDNPDTFTCPGTAQSGAPVRITRTAGPAVTIDGVATDTATKSTGTADARGVNVSFTVRCVSPNCTGTNTFNLRVLGAPSGSQAEGGDNVNKTWVAPGTPAQFDVFPVRDTNEVNTTHTLTCRVLDELQEGVANQNCDFEVTAGPNSTRTFVTGQPVGWIGDCFTAANGQCSVSYSSSATGEDTIRGWRDLNGNNVFDEPDNDLHRRIVSKNWVGVGFAPSQVRLDMEGADCVTFNATADPNTVLTNHEICAQAQDQLGNPAPAPITFTIVSGPGFFTDTSTSTVNRGTTITTQHDAAGVGSGARTFIRSAEPGNTVVQACVEGTTICSSNGTKPWRALEPRNVTLTPTSDTNPPGTNHEITALVTDRLGNPVAGATPISWSRTGAGFVVSQETTTNAAGQARIVIRSDTEGTTTVTVDITGANEPGGTSPNECAAAAGTPAGAPAGNCTASATKTWETPPPPPPPPIDHDDVRTIGLQRFRGPRLRRRRVIVKGRVRVAPPNADHAQCFANVPVRVQRRFLRGAGSRRFRTLRTITTGGAGVYRTRLFRPRRAHRIRVVARPLTVADHNCLRAVNSRRVRRRR